MFVDEYQCSSAIVKSDSLFTQSSCRRLFATFLISLKAPANWSVCVHQEFAASAIQILSELVELLRFRKSETEVGDFQIQQTKIVALNIPYSVEYVPQQSRGLLWLTKKSQHPGVKPTKRKRFKTGNFAEAVAADNDVMKR